MDQKRIDYERFHWGMTIILYPVFFILSLFRGSVVDDARLIGSVIGVSVIPVVIFLTTRLFSTFSKRNSEVIVPRWVDLFIVYVVSFCGALPCLLFSARTYWIAVPVLTILALSYVLLRKHPSPVCDV